MSAYGYDNDRFIIKNFDKQKTFSNFLPAVSGQNGIPLWVFYVNRGQGISGFGLQDKAAPIMEFSPASIAYERVSYNGFRTFLKIDGVGTEAFKAGEKIDREMSCCKSGFDIKETSADYEVKASYFGIPNMPFGALVRQVEITNLSDKQKRFEICDGLAELLPFGITNTEQKEVGNLMVSFMKTECDGKIACYKMKSSTFDTTEMEEVKRVNFYMSFGDGGLFDPVYDPDIIFGYDTSKTAPTVFFENDAKEVLKFAQCGDDKLCCGFTVADKELKPNETFKIVTLIGACEQLKFLSDKNLLSFDFIDEKRAEAETIINDLTSDVKTSTAYPLFDKYMEQCYLDNILRGGYPVNLGGHTYYIYSRKHGDLERDYNWFVLSPEYLSSGEGNFRDVAQNRRNDVLFKPEVGDYNIKLFYNLLQLDGGNPLVVEVPKFSADGIKSAKAVTDSAKTAEAIDSFLSSPFSPGRLKMLLEGLKEKLNMSVDAAFDKIMSLSKPNFSARFGEGYWIDHFTYLIDLIEEYLKIYPDKLKELFFFDESYGYFSAKEHVLPRALRNTLTKNGVRRINSLKSVKPTQMFDVDKNGMEVKTCLAAKLLNQICVKIASLDPDNFGIDMETNKPGWNDAMNGLPAIFGSSFGEVIELLRIVKLVSEALRDCENSIRMLAEQAELMYKLTELFEALPTPTEYYNKSNDLKEIYRQRVYDGVSGEYTSVELSRAKKFAALAERKLDGCIANVGKEYDGFYPTFFTYEATEYEGQSDGRISVKAFKRRALPKFAESVARSYKISGLDHESLYDKVKKSDIYDKTLKVYKTSESLEKEGLNIGRIRVFNAGWLERESCFLHMNYKYIYGILRAGLYDKFYKEIYTNLTPFMDAEKYGRNVLENSSFIVTDVKSDKKLIGRGFQPRLSGANAEALSIYAIMFFGLELFRLNGAELEFSFNPKLHADFFKADGTASATLFGKTIVTYHNPKKINTYDEKAKIIKLVLKANETCDIIEENRLIGDKADKLRRGYYDSIDVYFE